jgi:hypothetical protein
MSTLTELPGDGDTVDSKARHYLQIADAIHEATNSLRKIAEPDSTISKAVDSIKDKAKEVADKITRAENRYRETSTALIEYAAALKDAQRRAHAAIVAAGNADDGGHAAAQKAHYETLVQTPGPDQAANQKQLTFWTQQVSHQQTDSGAAHSAWQKAHDDKETAAKVAADKINNSLKTGKLNDTWWDDFTSWAGGVLEVLRTICEIAAFLSIFLSWVPFLGEALMVLAIVGALLTLADAINAKVHGEGSWGAIIMAGVGLVLTAFGGKIFDAIGKFAKMRGISTAMREGGPIRRLTGLGPGNNLRSAASDYREATKLSTILNPLKMDHDLSFLSKGPLVITQHVLGISEGAFVHGFNGALFNSGKMVAARAGIVLFEYDAIAGRTEKLVNLALPEDKAIHLTVGG